MTTTTTYPRSSSFLTAAGVAAIMLGAGAVAGSFAAGPALAGAGIAAIVQGVALIALADVQARLRRLAPDQPRTGGGDAEPAWTVDYVLGNGKRTSRRVAAPTAQDAAEQFASRGFAVERVIPAAVATSSARS